MSGLIQKSRLDQFAVLTAMPPEHVTYLKRFMILSDTIAFYWKFRGAVVNSRVSLDVEKAELGRFPVTGQMQDNKSFLQTYLEDRSAAIPGHHIENLSFDNGVMTVDGTVPKKFPLEGIEERLATPVPSPSVAPSPSATASPSR
jgi:hypothetical protein